MALLPLALWGPMAGSAGLDIRDWSEIISNEIAIHYLLLSYVPHVRILYIVRAVFIQND